jgi:ACS family sodium-dependent inorganic phosphate cotransporter
MYFLSSGTLSKCYKYVSASAIPAICLVAVNFFSCQEGLIFALMAVGTTLMGGMFSGFLSNHIDIAPRFAGNKLAGTQCLQLIHTSTHWLREALNYYLHADSIYLYFT